MRIIITWGPWNRLKVRICGIFKHEIGRVKFTDGSIRSWGCLCGCRYQMVEQR